MLTDLNFHLLQQTSSFPLLHFNPKQSSITKNKKLYYNLFLVHIVVVAGHSTETLAIMINQLLPETLTYLTAINSQHYGADYKMWRSSQVYGLIETQCFLRFLSAVLERNAPKEEMAAWSRSNTSRSSRANSQAGSRCNSMVFTQRYS